MSVISDSRRINKHFDVTKRTLSTNIYSTTLCTVNMDDLSPTNYVYKIKSMDSRERAKIQVKRLIEIICQVPDDPNVDDVNIATQFDQLRLQIQHINETSTKNATEIATLNIKNAEYLKKNVALSAEIELLKIHAQQCKAKQDAPPPQAPPPPAPDAATNKLIDELNKEIIDIKSELNSIQQYLRINNLEVVGLPEPNPGEDEETLLINAFNALEGIDEPIRPEDIDISHPLNSNRKDGKPVHVVRFVHRKTKHAIMAAKKKDENKQFKFRNRDIYINEHLSKSNRALFAAAQEKKRLVYLTINSVGLAEELLT